MSFEAFGEPVLKQAPEVIAAPTDPASFVLLPYCNRIAHGRGGFEGESVHLSPELAGEPHALHGEGWVSNWSVEAQDDTSAVLSLRHSPVPGRWPWSFEATQRYELAETRLVHALRLQNTSDRPMPAGLGFHPYFPRADGDRFTAHVEGRWNVSDDLLPTEHEGGGSEDYWPDRRLPGDFPLDHCFTGWDGKLTITRDKMRISVAASQALNHLHIYAPTAADFFCAEPVSHMPDALNRMGEPGRMHLLQPNETFEASMTYLVENSA